MNASSFQDASCCGWPSVRCSPVLVGCFFTALLLFGCVEVLPIFLRTVAASLAGGFAVLAALGGFPVLFQQH